MRRVNVSVSRRSASAVDPTTSENTTVTVLRDRCCSGDCRGAPHAWQKRARFEFASPQLMHIGIWRAYASTSTTGTDNNAGRYLTSPGSVPTSPLADEFVA